jgi:hypothetical protein
MLSCFRLFIEVVHYRYPFITILFVYTRWGYRRLRDVVSIMEGCFINVFSKKSNNCSCRFQFLSSSMAFFLLNCNLHSSHLTQHLNTAVEYLRRLQCSWLLPLSFPSHWTWSVISSHLPHVDEEIWTFPLGTEMQVRCLLFCPLNRNNYSTISVPHKYRPIHSSHIDECYISVFLCTTPLNLWCRDSIPWRGHANRGFSLGI